MANWVWCPTTWLISLNVCAQCFGKRQHCRITSFLQKNIFLCDSMFIGMKCSTQTLQGFTCNSGEPHYMAKTFPQGVDLGITKIAYRYILPYNFFAFHRNDNIYIL